MDKLNAIAQLLTGSKDVKVKVKTRDDGTMEIEDIKLDNAMEIKSKGDANKMPDFVSGLVDTFVNKSSDLGQAAKSFAEAVKRPPTTMELLKECEELALMHERLSKATYNYQVSKTKALIEARISAIEKSFKDMSGAGAITDKDTPYAKIPAKSTSKKPKKTKAADDNDSSI